MAVYVNTNVSSLNGRRYLNNVQNQLTTTYQRLSSGLRINSAKDDAAGLQIADRLTSQINGLNQGNRNSNDAIALAQTMEGALDETSSMLQKIRTLAVQSANGTNTADENQGNRNSNDAIALAQTMEGALDETSSMLQKIRTLAVQSANGTNTADDRKALQQEVSSLSLEISRIAEQTKFGGQQILDGADTGMLDADGNITFQVGANKGDEIILKGFSAGFKLSGIATVANVKAEGATKTGLLIDANLTAVRWSVSVADAAKLTIESIDKFIAAVDGKRADLGAFQNRLESSIRNQSNVSANQSDARSRIRDADFAEESAALSQQSIIQQAATSMLMQANSRPQLALSMLG